MIIRRRPSPERTTFFTPAEFNLQVGKIVYAKGTEIPRHTHLPVERKVSGTSEVLLIERGRVIADIYADQQTKISSHELSIGDILILFDGGHGFRLLEDTILVEVKQGPYSAQRDKERF